MTKVHPNGTTTSTKAPRSNRLVLNKSSSAGDVSNDVVLTVWKKSLLLNCSGFTVFDAKGNLVFRVDNYAASNRAEIVLMDAAGYPLLTLRRKRLSLSGEQWLVYDGDSAAKPRFTARKQAHLLNTRCLARVTSGRSASSPTSKNEIYEVEGSYPQRCCSVYDNQRRKVAEIKQKEAAVGGAAFGGEVFRLVVQPGMDTAVAMGMVIALEQMYGCSRF